MPPEEPAARDYGGLITRIPSRVLAPRTVDELAAQVRALRAERVPWVVRGAGHSSGGQALIHGGAVIEMRNLTAILADTGAAITVQAGIHWLALVEHLARDGRRPVVLTDQLRTSVGGTLSVGGVGDTSHLEGLQIDHALALVLVTPDGEIHRVRPGDALFDLALAGQGQLGAIAEVTLATCQAPMAIAVRGFAFPSLAVYLAAPPSWRYVRAKMSASRITALVGAFSTSIDDAPPAALAGATAASEPEVADLLAHAIAHPVEPGWFAPCAELVLPLPRALDIWAELAPAAIPHLGDGASVALVAPGRRLPLSPIPAEGGVVIALRPRLRDEVGARRVAAALRDLCARALAAGARLYPIGEEPDDVRWARQQYAAAWPAWTALKDAVDSDRLCHPWRL